MEDPRPLLLAPLPPQRDLPPGDTFKCRACGTRVRRGQVHIALKPWPHDTLEHLIKEERLVTGTDGVAVFA
jgi:hypothetical protein